MNAADQLDELLDLATQPVAIQFRATAPENLPRVNQTVPSGCTFWKLAAEGRAFYTDAVDHFGCPIGSYTHGIDMPAETARKLDDLIRTMVRLEYVKMEEVPAIPRRTDPFGVALYAPLRDASFEPDVVLIVGNAKQIMLLAEAAQAAGVPCETATLGRPTCAAIPAALVSQRAVANLGCIGNRVYTGLPDDQFYFVITGRQFDAIVEKLAAIVRANRELETFHRQRIVETKGT